jgi:YD repeat-containing protein
MTHTRVINALNEVYQDVNAAGTSAVTTTFGYDSNRNQTSIAAPLLRNSSNQYDALNRLAQITDPASGITHVGYDANDNLASVQDPKGLTTAYTHNGFGDVTKLVSPDTGTSLSSYDSGGNLKTATDARSAVGTYSYDALNRVTQVAYSDQTIIFAYDTGTNGKGRLTGASDANHSLSWAYDALGRITGTGLVVGSVTRSVGYGYSNADMTSIVTPSGQTITYGYTNHQITSVSVDGTSLLTQVTYEPFGEVNKWTWGNGTITTRTHDTDGKTTQIQTGGETYNYSYDNASHITGIANVSNPALSWTYGFDTLDRLTSAAKPSFSESWTYDANGNRLTQGGTDATTFAISPTNNQFSSVGGWVGNGTPNYDPAGHLTQLFGGVATFNNAGRAVSVNYGLATQYVYNALGERVKKTVASVGTSIFVYDTSHHLLGEYDGSGNLIQETVWMGNIPVATLRPSGSGVAIYLRSRGSSKRSAKGFATESHHCPHCVPARKSPFIEVTPT